MGALPVSEKERWQRGKTASALGRNMDTQLIHERTDLQIVVNTLLDWNVLILSVIEQIRKGEVI